MSRCSPPDIKKILFITRCKLGVKLQHVRLLHTSRVLQVMEKPFNRFPVSRKHCCQIPDLNP